MPEVRIPEAIQGHLDMTKDIDKNTSDGDWKIEIEADNMNGQDNEIVFIQ